MQPATAIELVIEGKTYPFARGTDAYPNHLCDSPAKSSPSCKIVVPATSAPAVQEISCRDSAEFMSARCRFWCANM
eukprot:3203007-Karenia_brevis.AAC.1